MICELSSYTIRQEILTKKLTNFGNVNILFVKLLLNKYNFTGVQAFVNAGKL